MYTHCAASCGLCTGGDNFTYSYDQMTSHVVLKMTIFQICAKPLIAKTELAALTIYADAPLDSREKSVKQVKKKIAYPHNEHLIKCWIF